MEPEQHNSLETEEANVTQTTAVQHLTDLPSGIPRLLHQIWFQGESHMPADYAKYARRLRELHPNYVYVLWDEEKIKLLISTVASGFYKTWCELPFMIQKIDSAKIFILMQYGGIYVDTDMEPLLSLEPLLTTHPLVFSKCYVSGIAAAGAWSFGLINFAATHINNGFIACSPAHPVILRTAYLLHKTAVKKRHPIFQVYIAETCGTEVLATALVETLQKLPELSYVAFDSDHFEPKVKAKNREPLITKNTRVIHHSYRTWAKLTTPQTTKKKKNKVSKNNVATFLLFTIAAVTLCVMCLTCVRIVQKFVAELDPGEAVATTTTDNSSKNKKSRSKSSVVIENKEIVY